MHRSMSSIKKVLFVATMFTASSAFAEFSLDAENSSVNFLSTKNVNVTESHTFDRFSGTVSESGALSLAVDLTSVNTIIPIRNERMQSMLFNVSEFARATFEANVDTSLLNLAPGESAMASIGGNLTISGITKPVSFHVRVTGLKDGQFSATTTKPTVINASDFDLLGGIEALTEVAMLQNISTTVPFSFSVVFTK